MIITLLSIIVIIIIFALSINVTVQGLAGLERTDGVD